jgi:hypothetical protein
MEIGSPRRRAADAGRTAPRIEPACTASGKATTDGFSPNRAIAYCFVRVFAPNGFRDDIRVAWFVDQPPDDVHRRRRHAVTETRTASPATVQKTGVPATARRRHVGRRLQDDDEAFGRPDSSSAATAQ